MTLKSLGKYQLIKRIAVGGMSEIYLSSQGGLHGFERAVILKRIREDLDAEQEVQEMFLDEARIAACLKHANIVHLYDVGRDNGVAYLAMEYIFGRDLMQVAERARLVDMQLPVWFVLKVMIDSLAGLHYAHEVAEFEDKKLKVIHRDVSPQNIIISFDGVSKILDFGIAKAEARMNKTQAGVLKGKYAYMSPEQVRGKPMDHRSDQFSMAVVFYEILTGTRLFQRDTDYSTMEAVDQCEIPPIRVLRKDVPRRLVRVLRKATRRNPKRRFASCKDMEQALHKLLRGSPVEQTMQMSAFMRDLFANELEARERVIAEADDMQREILLKTGFEMALENTSRGRKAKAAPSAARRYEEILAAKEAKKNPDKVPALLPDENLPEDQDTFYDGVAQQRGQQQDEPVSTSTQASMRAMGQAPTRPPRPRPRPKPRPEPTELPPEEVGGLFSDWRVLLVVFALVLGLGFLGMQFFEEEAAIPAPSIGDNGLPNEARPGLDGFLSVSVRASVEVLVDGKSLGLGAFRNQPLTKGKHTVIIRDTNTGKKTERSVEIVPNGEKLLAPQEWQ
ncbi:MAG: serine/threonine protein kinase [Deltaproteobacteria bacterium]|nr:serine/threonine protein kinase [Deltaproteobacteria bacterium]